MKSDCGVRLILLEQVTPLGTVRSQHYRLTTLRPARPRVLADLELAEDAFDLEVVASLLDPVVQQVIMRH